MEKEYLEESDFQSQTAKQREQYLTGFEASRTEQKERIEHMILYHGSKIRLDELESHQAMSKAAEAVPEGELLDAIYLTPDYASALAMAARPEGVTRMRGEGDERTIEFEHPELFNPNQEVYIYQIDSDNIPQENLTKIDEGQYVAVGMRKLKPDSFEVRRAGDIFQYYKQKR